MNTKTICLNMIVKNESHVIINTLECLVKFFPFSYWVISDTGSTDNTKELIIDLTRHLDSVEELYNKVNNEISKRTGK